MCVFFVQQTKQTKQKMVGNIFFKKKEERAPRRNFLGCAAHGSRTSCALTGGRSDNFFFLVLLPFLPPPNAAASRLLLLVFPSLTSRLAVVALVVYSAAAPVCIAEAPPV